MIFKRPWRIIGLLPRFKFLFFAKLALDRVGNHLGGAWHDEVRPLSAIVSLVGFALQY